MFLSLFFIYKLASFLIFFIKLENTLFIFQTGTSLIDTSQQPSKSNVLMYIIK